MSGTLAEVAGSRSVGRSTPLAPRRPAAIGIAVPRLILPTSSRSMRAAFGRTGMRRAFTLVEVLIATFLLGVVGTAIAAFLSALASGGDARQHLSDPSIESTLAMRRIQVLAPEFRTVLLATSDSAMLWTSDRIASRSVHLSEVALVRFDADTEELQFETVDADAIASDRSLEREYLIGQYGSILGLFDSLRLDGLLIREVLSEGNESVQFSEVTGSAGIANVTFLGADSSVRVRLAPDAAEEPLR